MYSVPGITPELEQDLVKAIAGTGVMSAKAVPKKGKFLVTFHSGEKDAETMLSALQGVSPDASLDKVLEANPKPLKADQHGAPGHDCGACPHASTCGGH